MILRLLYVLAFLLFSFENIFGQIVNLFPNELSFMEPDLKTEELKKNKVKQIKSEFSYKTETGRIREKGITILTELDEEGRIVQQIKITLQSIEPDSSITYFFYKEGKLHITRTYEGSSIKASYYDYDSLNYINKIVETHETNIGESRELFKIGKQEITFMETFEHIPLTKNQIKKKCYNDIGKVYKEAIIHLDDHKRKTGENYRYSFTGISIEHGYKYDNLNRLIEKTYFTDAGKEIKELNTYTFDANNNVSLEKFSRNNAEISETFYFYDKQNVLLEAMITKQTGDKSIIIRKLSYEFY